jgi:hypothetical protein
MFVDVILPGWAPFDIFNLNEDVPGSIESTDKVLAYPWKHFIGGHMGRLGTRNDVTVYQQYVADIIANIKSVLGDHTIKPTTYFQTYLENGWAAVKEYLDAVASAAAKPVIEKYTGVLGAVDVYTKNSTYWILESLRLDLGLGSLVHP